jgi:hypothetical protein
MAVRSSTGTLIELDAGLLERADELRALREAIEGSGTGGGRLVLVAGPAGIGKTRLLDACEGIATEASVAVRSVRGDELVVDSAFAAVRELFYEDFRTAPDQLLAGAAGLAAPVFEGDVAERSDGGRVAGVLHGLYWFVANLAERGPLALLVDDAHWLDAASARFLAYLARRLSSIPVVLLAATRTGEGADGEGFGALIPQAANVVLRPKPLSEAAVATVVRDELGVRADDELCRSCLEATGGNPFYLRELTTALKTEGGRPTVELARHVRELGAGSIGRSVLVRLARLGPGCERLAEALAILAPGSPLRHVAALAQLERSRAEPAADALRAADILAPDVGLTFAHPVVREAVAAEMSPSARAALHGRAARLLLEEGAEADRVAAHLLGAEPYGEAWAVEALRGAARRRRPCSTCAEHSPNLHPRSSAWMCLSNSGGARRGSSIHTVSRSCAMRWRWPSSLVAERKSRRN